MLNGIMLGLMTYATMVVTFLKLPKRLQQWFLKHKLLTDLSAGVIIYLILGAISKSIIAIVGAITGGLLVGLTLEIVGNAKPTDGSGATAPSHGPAQLNH